MVGQARPYKFLLMISTLVLLIIVVGRSCPYSQLFSYINSDDNVLRSALKFNQIRHYKAMEYFRLSKKMDEKTINARMREGNTDVVATIVTVWREQSNTSEGGGYLIQTAAAMNAILQTNKGGLNTILVVCNADAKPERHKDAKVLQTFLPYINRKTSNVVKIDPSYRHVLRSDKLKDKNRRKEIEDYVFCMNATRGLNSSYILMLEDDVLPEMDMVHVLQHTLNQRFEHARQRGKSPNRIAFVKLYYPSRWQGFAFERDRLTELICVGIVGSVVVIICQYSLQTIFLKIMFSQNTVRIIAKRYKTHSNFNETIVQNQHWSASWDSDKPPILSVSDANLSSFNTSLFYLSFIKTCTFIINSRVRYDLKRFMFWTITIILFAKLVDRVALLELRRLSPWLYKFGTSPACCTQAMLYPSHVTVDLMRHLLVNGTMNKDLAIHDFVVKGGASLQGYHLEPNLFKHIGMQTSLSADSGYKDPKEFLFDMPFELTPS